MNTICGLEHDKIKQDMNTILIKLSHIEAILSERCSFREAAIISHEERLKKVESIVDRWSGMLVVIVGACSLVSGTVVAIVSKMLLN